MAQTFAIGAGGGILNDTGSAANLDNFSTGAGYGFVEMKLEPGVLMQARYTRMQLPPWAENGPDIDVDAATLTMAYLFKEDWWQAGFVAGRGGYFLNPKDPGPGQAVTDRDESVFGLTSRLLTRLYGEPQDRHPAGGRRAPPPGFEQPEAGPSSLLPWPGGSDGNGGVPARPLGSGGKCGGGFFLVGLM